MKENRAVRTSSTGNQCDLSGSGEKFREALLERVMFELRPEETQEFVRCLSVFVRIISVANGSNPTQTSFSKRHLLTHVAGK